jgi:DNA-binding winged helix-turn-helix (wHTH) protein/TolB-like protein/Tfp pilus assembly protein PilF
MNKSGGKQFSFSSFWLDVEKRQLLHRNQPIVLTRKALDTLTILVQNAGRVVSREELKRLVWGEVFVEEATIAQNIFTLRKTLGEHEPGQNLIETIAGVGYRFTGRVEPYSPEIGLEKSEGLQHARPVPISSFQLRFFWVVLLVVGLGVVAAGWWRYEAHAPRIQSLAVLPFANLTGDPQQEYLAEGISDALLTDVAQISGLRVISGSSRPRDAKSEPARKIPRDLHVDAVVEGAVLKSGDQLAVDVRLVQAADDQTLWTARFQLSPHDLLGLDYTISRALTRQLEPRGKVRLAARESSVGTGNVEAYGEYLKGRFFWNKRTEDAFVKAIAYFNHAIALDPKYAHAYAGLADAYALLGSLPNATIPRREAMPKAREAALTALQLDESLAEAHTSLAFVKMQYEWDWPGSEKEFKRALELNPSYPTVHQWYAIWLTAQGNVEAAFEEERRAQQADPLSMIIKTDTVQLLIYAKRCDEAMQEALRALEIDPTFLLARIFLAQAYAGKQDYPTAIEELRKALDADKGNIWVMSELAVTYALANQKEKSRVILRDLLNLAKGREDVTLDVAEVYATLGDKDQAFAWLEKAYLNREGGLILLNRVRELQSLHDDVRFADLDRRMGLPAVGEE